MAANPRVTACDIAHVPLPLSAVDVAVFCLSLMGTNFHVFLQEAHRVLRLHGRLLVAEVKSRIPDLAEFTAMVESIGFTFIGQVRGSMCAVDLPFY